MAWGLFASALAFPPAAGAAGEVGRIRICRYPGIVERWDHEAVQIPKGTGFVDADNPKTGDPIGPSFLIVTTESVRLPPRPACVTVAAVVRENPKGFAITTRYPYALPSQLVGPEIVGRVVSDFR